MRVLHPHTRLCHSASYPGSLAGPPETEDYNTSGLEA